ncbi:NADP-dependent oxidoreductase domain-containing protein [Leptodontidium sp. MPI-SDFR-AT-0119]|nr:NADP-dependent oxidoreductase domain-containing protein [Leptodontidium sp. MPI-SDFR-AT-0119]
MAQAPAIVFGTAGVGAFSTEQLSEVFDILDKHNVKQLDTARLYGPSEGVLGKAGAPKRFIISTKALGFSPGSMSKQGVLESVETSLKELQVEQVDIFYLHSPDPSTPIEETLAAIQEIYAAGKFKRFGLSNFRPADVQKIYDIQAAAKSVLPSVFQGNYSAVSRHIESDLFPLLRKLKISFYAYSPIAGGFLVKDAKSLREQSAGGRWGKDSPIGDMYVKMYTKDSMLDALDQWETIAKDAGIPKASLAYRWIAYHSSLKATDGDAIIIGASRPSQVEDTCSYIKQGPLDAKIAERASALWKSIEKDAPIDNWNSHAGLKV